MKSQTPDVLIDQMRANSNTKRPLELTKTAIIAQIKARKTEDFEFSAMKISLIDPVSKLTKIIFNCYFSWPENWSKFPQKDQIAHIYAALICAIFWP